MNGSDVADYWEQRLAGGPTLDKVGYRALGRHFNEWMYRVRRAHFVHRVGEALRRYGIDVAQADILDAGCGSGFYIERWRELGARRLSGWDITVSSVNALREKHPGVTFERMDIGTQMSPAGAFDCITCMDVLFHIVDDEKYAHAIANIARLLNPGGVFVFTENCLHERPLNNPFQNSRTLTEIERLLEANGLAIVERRPMFALMNAPIDSKNSLLHAYWKALHASVARSEALGWLLGALLYIPERIITSLLSEGPSTEMLICRRM